MGVFEMMSMECCPVCGTLRSLESEEGVREDGTKYAGFRCTNKECGILLEFTDKYLGDYPVSVDAPKDCKSK